MPRKARRATEPSVATTDSRDPELVATEKAELQQRAEDARASIADAAARISGKVESSVESVKSTVDTVLSIPEKLQREPVAWSLGALSAGFALGYALGRAHDSKTAGKRGAQIADDVAAELGTFMDTLVPQRLASEIKESLGFDVSAALARIARANEPAKRVRHRKTSRAKHARA
jgi:hypothetical protein